MNYLFVCLLIVWLSRFTTVMLPWSARHVRRILREWVRHDRHESLPMMAKFVHWRCDYSYKYDYTTTYYSLTNSLRTTTPLLLYSSYGNLLGQDKRQQRWGTNGICCPKLHSPSYLGQIPRLRRFESETESESHLYHLNNYLYLLTDD